MDKTGGSVTMDYVHSLSDGEPAFFSTVSMATRDAMKENVREAIRQFALMD